MTDPPNLKFRDKNKNPLEIQKLDEALQPNYLACANDLS